MCTAIPAIPIYVQIYIYILHVYSESTESVHQESLRGILALQGTQEKWQIKPNLKKNVQFTYTVLTKTKEEGEKVILTNLILTKTTRIQDKLLDYSK